jgi:hypothetical protein
MNFRKIYNTVLREMAMPNTRNLMAEFITDPDVTDYSFISYKKWLEDHTSNRGFKSKVEGALNAHIYSDLAYATIDEIRKNGDEDEKKFIKNKKFPGLPKRNPHGPEYFLDPSKGKKMRFFLWDIKDGKYPEDEIAKEYLGDYVIPTRGSRKAKTTDNSLKKHIFDIITTNPIYLDSIAEKILPESEKEKIAKNWGSLQSNLDSLEQKIPEAITEVKNLLKAKYYTDEQLKDDNFKHENYKVALDKIIVLSILKTLESLSPQRTISLDDL